MRTGRCMDCSGAFEHEARTGPIPKRCVRCRVALRAAYDRRSYAIHGEELRARAGAYWRAKNPRIRSRLCSSCDAIFEYEVVRGRRRLLCDECQELSRLNAQSRYRDKHRQRLRAKHRAYAAAKRTDQGFLKLERDKMRERRRLDPDRASEIRKRSYRLNAVQRRADSAARRTIKRDALYDRDGGICHLCQKPVSRQNFHVDHLVPRSKGGPDTPENLAVAHPFCNQSRGAGRVPAQLRLVA